MRLAVALLASAVLVFGTRARADETPSLPWWAAGRARVPDLDRKVEGGFPDGFPLVGYDPNTGVGFGVGVHYTLTGSRKDPLFAYTPYRQRFYAQVYATTGGYQQHVLSYDGFYVADAPYRIRAVLQYERNTGANYFGVGTATLANLSYGGTSYATYDAAANAAGPKYFHYGYERPQGQVILERSFLGGRLRALYGFSARYDSITRFDTALTTTKLGLDCAAARVTGCTGGWNNTLRAGVAYDTRDFDPDANTGVFVDSNGHWSAKGFGSSSNYLRWTTAARVFVSPFPQIADVVVTGRALYSLQSAAVPFYAVNTLAMAGGTDDSTDQQGLGGERTLRGYRQDRFIGLAAVAVNAEIRYTFAKFVALGQHISIQVAPFVDAGRVFDRLELSLTDWKGDVGAGVRLAYNQSTILILDYGVSREDSALYIDAGTAF